MSKIPLSEIPDDIRRTADHLACISGIATRAYHTAKAILSERQHHAEVRKLLQPFAAEAAVYDPDTGDGDDAVWATPAYFRIKHLRAVRALLSRLEER